MVTKQDDLEAEFGAAHYAAVAAKLQSKQEEKLLSTYGTGVCIYPTKPSQILEVSWDPSLRWP